MRYWICPKCGCITQDDRSYCDNPKCQYPIKAMGYAEALGYQQLHPTFNSVTELDAWIKMATKYMGAKVWRVK